MLRWILGLIWGTDWTRPKAAPPAPVDSPTPPPPIRVVTYDWCEGCRSLVRRGDCHDCPGLPTLTLPPRCPGCGGLTGHGPGCPGVNR